MFKAVSLVVLLVASVVLAPLALAQGSGPRGDPAVAALQGSLVPLVQRAQRLHELPSSQGLSVGVTFRLRDEAGLQRFLAAVYDPRSTAYHHFLTPRQFAARFAPAPAQVRRVTDWLQARGLRVTRRFANGMEVVAQGPAGRVEQAFATRLYSYRAGSRRFFANAAPAHLPASLAGLVQDVAGLTNVMHQVPSLSRLHAPSRDNPPFGLGPQDIATAYDLGPLDSQGLNGNGETIGLYELADFQDKNIAAYDRQFSISAGSVDRVKIRDGQNLGGDLVDESECELDIEIIHAVAPRANVVVYEAENDDTGAISVWNQMVSDNRVQLMSASWSSPEEQNTADDRAAMDTAFQEAAAQGQTVFISSGDNGAYSNPDHPQELSVDYPSSDPWVTVVGGTTLYRNYDGTYSTEKAWSDPSSSSPVGSGGGLSDFFARPSYQMGPGVDNQYSTGKRQTPDVAADADPNVSPYAVYTIDDQGNVGWMGVGGTSASSPLWASYTALLAEKSGSRIGFFNPTLYRLGSKAASFAQPPFHDVTRGDNLYYPATPGWDYATGWGSFDGAALMADMAQLNVPAPAPSPTPTSAAAPPPATATPRPAPRSSPTSRTLTSSPSLVIRQLEVLGMNGRRSTAFKRGERVRIVARYVLGNVPGAVSVRVAWSYRYQAGGLWKTWGPTLHDLVDGTDGVHARSRTVVLPRSSGSFQAQVSMTVDRQSRHRTVTVHIR